MAARSRHRLSGVALSPILKTLFVGGILLGGVLQLVYLKNKSMTLGREIARLEQQLAAIRQDNERLRKQILVLQTPAVIESRVRELKLGLLPPGPWQEVYVLSEPGPEEIEVTQPHGFVGQTATIVP